MVTSSTHKQHLGGDNWNGLLDQHHILDLGLGNFIQRCGHFCQAASINFKGHRASLHGSRPLYTADELFTSVPVLAEYRNEYKVVAYLTADISGQSNWIGYVAATDDEATMRLGRREVYIICRGTKTLKDWITNILGTGRVTFKDNDPEAGKVHGGWRSMSEGPKSQVVKALEKCTGRYPISVVVTGHSLGGALATLTAVDLVMNGGPITTVAGVVFGCPQVGCKKFMERFKTYNDRLKILHVKCRGDFVPRLPDHKFTYFVPIETRELVLISTSLGHVFRITKKHKLNELLALVAGQLEKLKKE